MVDTETYLTDKCPTCGKFCSRHTITNGWYDLEDRNNDSSPTILFCSKTCADHFHQSQTIDP